MDSLTIIKQLCESQGISFQESERETQKDFFTGEIIAARPRWTGSYLELPIKTQN